VGTAPSDYALEASLERKKSIPALLFIDQEPESCWDEYKYTLRMMATPSGRSNNGWAYVIFWVTLCAAGYFGTTYGNSLPVSKRQLMINMRLISVLFIPEVKFSKYS
jgi:hypothetical protein